MNNTKRSKETRLSGNCYFKAYQKLSKQRARIDQEMLKLQKKFLETPVGITGTRKKYVSRLHNTTTLISAIRKSMIPTKKMTMNDIIGTLKKKGLYHTKSKYFYTMVNNKLNRDKLIKKIARGVFVYNPRKVATVV